MSSSTEFHTVGPATASARYPCTEPVTWSFSQQLITER